MTMQTFKSSKFSCRQFLLLLTLYLLQTCLWSQEQVSNIEFKSISEPTNIITNVGFALYNGEQYMIEEKDSVVISKYNGSTFIPHKTISDKKCWARFFTYINPNRSLFEIHDQYYYRFSREGVEVIDIEKGIIVKELDVSAQDIIFYSPLQIFQDKLYFTGIVDNVFQNYKFEMNTGHLSQIIMPTNRTKQFYHTNYMIGIENNKNIYFYNMDEGRDSLLYQSNDTILSINTSLKDSTIWYLENNGKISKIDKNLQNYQSSCTISNLDKLRSINIDAENVILIYNNSNNGTTYTYKVEINNFTTCNNDMSFVTGIVPSYAVGVSFVKNENPHDSISIFGFYGGNPTDGFNDGLFYIIDYSKKSYKAIEHISNVLYYTPFIENNNLYFVGAYSSFWGSNYNFIKYNLSAATIQSLQPFPQSTPLFAKLGFSSGNKFICSSNQSEDDPTIWNLNDDNSFAEIQKLNYASNLGVDHVVSSTIFNDKIYFVCNGGLYSMKNSSTPEILFPNSTKKPNAFYNVPIATYKTKIAIPLPTEEFHKFVTIDTKDNSVDTFRDNNVRFREFDYASGPFIFYSKGNGNDTLNAFDLKTNSILKFPQIPYIITSWILRGIEKTVVFNRDGGDIIRIDNETNKTEYFEMDMGYHGNYSVGSNNSFYFMNQRIQPNKNQLILLKNNGEIKTLYEGHALLTKNSFFNDLPYNIACLREPGDSIIIIANDTESTIKSSIVHTAYEEPIIAYKLGKLLLKTKDTEGTKYRLYRLFNPLVDIDIPIHNSIMFSEFSDDSTLIMILAKGTDIIFYSYNINSNTSTERLLDKNHCDYLNLQKGIRLNSTEYLFSIGCDYNYEPWLFDKEKLEFTQLNEINPGFESSFPDNFIRFEDWIYFTATKKDKSNQWFRVNASLSSKVVEVEKPKVHNLKIYPIPAINEIKIDEDLNEIYIFSTHGIKIYSKIDYVKNDPINITFLSSGNHILVGKNGKNEIVVGKIIKM